MLGFIFTGLIDISGLTLTFAAMPFISASTKVMLRECPRLPFNAALTYMVFGKTEKTRRPHLRSLGIVFVGLFIVGYSSVMTKEEN